MADWVTISALATAGGTLVLVAATFASVRSANRSARATERALLAGTAGAGAVPPAGPSPKRSRSPTITG